MAQLFTNNARAKLQSSIQPTDVQLVITASLADLFPIGNTANWSTTLNWFKAIEDDEGNIEIVKVGVRTLGSGVFSNVLRAQDGTTARNFSTGAAVELRFTADDLNQTESVRLDLETYKSNLANQANTSLGATFLGWIRNAIAGAVGAKLSEWLGWQAPSVLEFMTAADRIKVLARTFDVDVSYAFAAAHAHCVLTKQKVCTVPSGGYLWGSAQNFSSGRVIFRGEGNSYTPTEVGSTGTWIKIASNAFTPASYLGNGPQGSGFCNMAITQVHPIPGVGWEPTVYPPVFNCNDVAGEMFFDDLYTPGVYKLVDSFYSGRLNMNRWRGQSFLYTAKVEGAYDCCHFDNFHDWPFWSQNKYVMKWTQENGDTLLWGRVDTPFADSMFSFAKRSTIHTYNSVDDPANPTVHPGGYPSLVNIGSIVADYSKYGPVWIESTDFSGNIGNWVCQGEAVSLTASEPLGNGIPCVGGYGMYITGANARFSIGKFFTTRHNNEAILVDAVGAVIQIGTAELQFYNYNITGVPGGTARAVRVTGTTSQVQFLGNPFLLGVGGVGLNADGIGVSTGMQLNTGGQAVNEVRGQATGTGIQPQVFVTGADAAISLLLKSKGAASRINFGQDGNVSVGVDQAGVGGSSNARILLRSNTASAQIISEFAGNADLELIPAGAGLVKINTPLNSGSLTPTGYINVKVASGSTIRLLVG
jgi:hypothetical protein